MAQAPLRVGDLLYGFCGGAFGRDSYEDKRVEAIGADWVLCRVTSYDHGLALYGGDPEDLCRYRFPLCPQCDHQGEPSGNSCSRCGEKLAGELLPPGHEPGSPLRRPVK